MPLKRTAYQGDMQHPRVRMKWYHVKCTYHAGFSGAEAATLG